MKSIACVGIGLRAQHVEELLKNKPEVCTLEVYSEDYMSADATWQQKLDQVRADYPLSLHGIGLSIASVDPLNWDYLSRLRTLVDRYQPIGVSDHLAWSSIDGRYPGDQYPFPRTKTVLGHLATRIAAVQDFLNRPILLENIAYYMAPALTEDYSEADFLNVLAARTGCQILLDVENLSINIRNHGGDGIAFIEELSQQIVEEIHLAGGEQVNQCGKTLLVDTHNRPPGPETLALFHRAIHRFPNAYQILEWDAEIPSLPVLLHTARYCASGST